VIPFSGGTASKKSGGQLLREVNAGYLARAKTYQISWKKFDMFYLSASTRCKQTRRWSMKAAKAADL
jgi:hypothetical protein